MQRALQIAKAKKWIMVLPDFPKVKFDAPDQKLRGKLHDDATLLKVWAALPDDVREACQVAVATGLRFTELCRLRASWVQAAPEGTDIAAVLVLPREATKSRKARAVGLGAETVKLIKQRAKVHGDQVFPHTSYGQALRRAAKTLGLSKTVTLRDLRHTFASNGLNASRASSPAPW